MQIANTTRARAHTHEDFFFLFFYLTPAPHPINLYYVFVCVPAGPRKSRLDPEAVEKRTGQLQKASAAGKKGGSAVPSFTGRGGGGATAAAVENPMAAVVTGTGTQGSEAVAGSGGEAPAQEWK